MCGIAGIYSVSPDNVSSDRLKRMSDSLLHRGPDGEGYYFSEDKRLGLAHRRLAIIDLSDAAQQPMKYLDRYSITYNGEIYNYLELRTMLTKNGYSFKSSSDTEVLLALYDWKKEKCLDYLDGMFAFSIYDEKEKTLFCARDRFGEKPFFYSYGSGEKFVFASEMKALFAAGVQKKINNHMLYNYIAWNYVNNPLDLSETFFVGVKKLPAAHYLIVNKNLKIKIEKYWSIDCRIQNKKISFDEASEKVRELLIHSTSIRLRSDVEVGSCLSGGLDSSTIVSIINKEKKTKQKTFSARFKYFEKDEGKYIDILSKKTNIESHDVFISDDSLLQNIDKIFFHQEEPFLSSSIVAQHEVMKAAKENGVKVLLDGQGSDEIFGGYDYLAYAYFQELFSKDRNKYKEEWGKFKQVNSFPLNRKAKFYLQASLPNIYPKFEKLKSFRKPGNHSEINKDFYSEYSSDSFNAPIRSKPDFNYMLHESACGEAMEQILRYSDRNSMAHSVEVRLPFLSHHLTEFLFTLPSNIKMREGWPKHLLRKSFENILPAEIAWRKDKIGFETPQNKWMSNKKTTELIRDVKTNLVKEKLLCEKSLASTNHDWRYWMCGKLLGS